MAGRMGKGARRYAHQRIAAVPINVSMMGTAPDKFRVGSKCTQRRLCPSYAGSPEGMATLRREMATLRRAWLLSGGHGRSPEGNVHSPEGMGALRREMATLRREMSTLRRAWALSGGKCRLSGGHGRSPKGNVDSPKGNVHSPEGMGALRREMATLRREMSTLRREMSTLRRAWALSGASPRRNHGSRPLSGEYRTRIPRLPGPILAPPIPVAARCWAEVCGCAHPRSPGPGPAPASPAPGRDPPVF
uniref:Uncharacterized protein n=1 Tax=Candidatus Kentrum sp. DK TaxID=2126562 RepID=A0A450STU1_9GAMM|nr:MAG: hypothetical protein BECKDK2373B_GA0170837_10656 [Candidatus Kentron sp. DK]